MSAKFVHRNNFSYSTIAYIVQQILNKRAVKELDQNEFHNGIRKSSSH